MKKKTKIKIEYTTNNNQTYVSFNNDIYETIDILNSDNPVNIKKITLYDSVNLIEMLRIKSK